MNNKPNVTLMALVVGMFISLLICMSTMAFFGYRMTSSDYKYDIMREEYTRRIEVQGRDYDTRYNRLQDQIYSLQFSTDKKYRLLEEQLQMYRTEKQK